MPKSNVDFWQTKINRNRERDQQNYQILNENGWQVIVVWECQLTSALIEQTMRLVELRLNQNFLSIYKPKSYAIPADEPLPMAAESQSAYGKQDE